MKFFVFLLAITSLFSADFQDFDQLQKKYSKAVVETRLKNFLQKDEALAQYYSITPTYLALFDLPKGNKGSKEEYRYFFASSETSAASKEKKEKIRFY